jgi:hypothetical protein
MIADTRESVGAKKAIHAKEADSKRVPPRKLVGQFCEISSETPSNRPAGRAEKAPAREPPRIWIRAAPAPSACRSHCATGTAAAGRGLTRRSRPARESSNRRKRATAAVRRSAPARSNGPPPIVLVGRTPPGSGKILPDATRRPLRVWLHGGGTGAAEAAKNPNPKGETK